jgi:hypothetical protein
MHIHQLVKRVCARMLLLGFSIGFAIDGSSATRPFTVTDDIELTHFGIPNTINPDALIFSPDNQYFVVLTERGRLDLNRPESRLRVYKTESVHQFLLHPEMIAVAPIWEISRATFKHGPIITNIRWLADSTGFAFLSETSTGREQLVMADLRKHYLRMLTPETVDVTAFDIQSASNFVYTARSLESEGDASADANGASIVATGRSLYSLIFPEQVIPSEALEHDRSKLWAVFNGKRFEVIQPTSYEAVTIFDRGQRALSLSPDGRSALTARAIESVPAEWETLYPPPTPNSPFRLRAGRQNLQTRDGWHLISKYAIVDLASGKMRDIINGPLAFNLDWWAGPETAWSSDGRFAILSGAFVPSQEDHSFHACVTVVEVRSGQASCVARLSGPADEFSNPQIGYVSRVGFVAGSDQRVFIDSFAIPGETHEIKTYMWSNDGVWFPEEKAKDDPSENHVVSISVNQTINDPPKLIVSNSSNTEHRIVWDPNPQLQHIALGKVSQFKWKDAYGEQTALLYLPPDYAPGRRYPLVVQTHGYSDTEFSPSGPFVTAFAARELAAERMLVLQVAGHHGCQKKPEDEGPCNVSLYESAVEKLDADGMVDVEHIGVIGFSRTVYHVLEALTTSSLHFTAASITDGATAGYPSYLHAIDLWNNIDNDKLHEYDSLNGGSPPFGAGLQQWIKRSPGFNLYKVSTPLQIVALNRFRSVLGAWEPYAVLRYLHKPVDLIVVPDSEHVLTNPSERIVSQGGTVDWFRFWLKGEEDTDPAKASQYERWRQLRALRDQKEQESR